MPELFELFDNELRLGGRAYIDLSFRIRIVDLYCAKSSMLRMYFRIFVSPSMESRSARANFFMQYCIDDPSSELIYQKACSRRRRRTRILGEALGVVRSLCYSTKRSTMAVQDRLVM